MKTQKKKDKIEGIKIQDAFGQSMTFNATPYDGFFQETALTKVDHKMIVDDEVRNLYHFVVDGKIHEVPCEASLSDDGVTIEIEPISHDLLIIIEDDYYRLVVEEQTNLQMSDQTTKTL